MTEFSGAAPIPTPGNGRSPAQSLTPEDRLARIRALIRDVPDFPKPGIMFRDVTTVLRDPVAWRATVTDTTNTGAGQLFVSLVAGSTTTSARTLQLDDLVLAPAP